MASIPASQLFDVTPSVLGAGGNALDLIGLFLTQNTRPAIGSVVPRASQADVGAFFGLSSPEYAAAGIYFSGFTGATATPGSMLFAQYPEVPVAAWMQGAPVASLTLAQLQALTGSLDITIDGHAFAAADIVLSAATSFSAAATAIAAALNTTLPEGATACAVVFDSLSGAFILTSGTTGATSSVAYATGTLAAGLGFTNAAGATLSQGADAATPSAFLSSVIDTTTNWATFTTMWEQSVGEGTEFAAWTTAQNNRYLNVSWNTDVNNKVSGSTETLAYAIGPQGDNSSGTAIIYSPNNGVMMAAFLCGFVAAIDFTAANGRATAAFKTTPGLVADVTSASVAANLKAAGVNYFGAWATANEIFTFLYPGCVTGKFSFVDSFVNEVWLTNQLQLAIMTGMTAAKSVPYAAPGYATVVSWLTDPAQQGLTFGAIVPGVQLSASQVSALKTMLQLDVSNTLFQVGYYIQVLPAIAQVRGERDSPPCNFIYSDGGSIQVISLASVMVQ